MVARWKVAAVFAMLALLVITGCTAGSTSGSASGSTSGSTASSTSASTSGSTASSTSASASGSTASASSSASYSPGQAGDAEDVVTIGLDYNAGTGYEWTCSVEPEGIVSQVGVDTVELTDDDDITGGPLRDRFAFRAIAPGEVILTFALERSWEDGDPAETHVYAFTVSDDLKMILNPYKSDFVNEPEWSSGS